MQNLPFALFKAKKTHESSVLHTSVLWELEIRQSWNFWLVWSFSDTVCIIRLCFHYLLVVDSSAPSLCAHSAEDCRGQFGFWPSHWSSSGLEWATASFCCFARSCLPSFLPSQLLLPGPALTACVQWKAPDRPQGYAPCVAFCTDSQRDSWQSAIPAVLYEKP